MVRKIIFVVVRALENMFIPFHAFTAFCEETVFFIENNRKAKRSASAIPGVIM